MLTRTRLVARRFAGAAAQYEQAAILQRLVAATLADRIVAACVRPPATILEIGCGTGLLTRALRRAFPEALIVATDIAPSMLAACRAAMPGDDRLLTVATDGQAPAVRSGFDLVCSSLALQWFQDPAGAWHALAALLSPGGGLHLATLADGSLSGWQDSHRAEGETARTALHPTLADLRDRTGAAWQQERIAIAYPDGLSFLSGLRSIGADLPRPGSRPLGAGALRRVLRRFEREHGSVADYAIAYGRHRRPARDGVFVTGTDTGIGKTFVSACLVAAWSAAYWKPFQTGLDQDPGDTETIAALTGCDPARLHPPALALRAPLSPEDAAALEGIAFDAAGLALPHGQGPLVVEGAGGVLVPLDQHTSTIDLIDRLGLPVVLVARSTLGTINHTLLSLGALRARGIAIAGVVLNGPPSPGNRAAIERHGQVRVLAEIPWSDDPGPAAVARFASLFPPYAAIERSGATTARGGAATG